MIKHVLKPPKNFSFTKVGIKGRIFPAKKVSKRTGFCLIQTDRGHKTTIIEHKCDFDYYVLGGKGYFEINGVKERCSKGDLVIIPAGLKFRYVGKLLMLLVSNPAFYPEQEETLKE